MIEHVTFCAGQCQRVCDSVTGITACHVHVASYTCYSLHVCMCKTKLSVYITIIITCTADVVILRQDSKLKH